MTTAPARSAASVPVPVPPAVTRRGPTTEFPTPVRTFDDTTTGPAPTWQPTPAARPPDRPPTVPLLGTRWYLVGRTNNHAHLTLPVDPEAWLQFSASAVTFHGTVERDPFGKGPGACPTLVLPATVRAGVLVYGRSALPVVRAREECGTRILNPFTPVRITRSGRELRIRSDVGNRTELLYTTDRPVPRVPARADLSFLPPATGVPAGRGLLSPLTGTGWRVTAVTGRSLADAPVTLRFGLDGLSVDTGCNRLGGRYTVDGDQIFVGGVAGTLMACHGERGDQENWLRAFLSGSIRYHRDGDELRLTVGGTTVISARTASEPAVPQPGAGTEIWVVDSIRAPDGDHRLPSLEDAEFASQEPSVTLTRSSLSFTDGCGWRVARTTGTDTRAVGIAVGTVVTRCPPLRAALGRALAAILVGPVVIRRDGPFVTLTGRGGLAVTAHVAFW